jgi:hypothetical protein
MAEHDETTPSEDAASEFAREAERKSHGVVAEFLGLLRHNKKWWLTPIIVVMLLLAGLVFLFGTGAAPLIYTLF